MYYDNVSVSNWALDILSENLARKRNRKKFIFLFIFRRYVNLVKILNFLISFISFVEGGLRLGLDNLIVLLSFGWISNTNDNFLWNLVLRLSTGKFTDLKKLPSKTWFWPISCNQITKQILEGLEKQKESFQYLKI